MTEVKNKELWEAIIIEMGNKIKEKYNGSLWIYAEDINKLFIKGVGGVVILNDMLYYYEYEGNQYKLVAIYKRFWEGNIIKLLALALVWYVHTGELVYGMEEAVTDKQRVYKIWGT